MCELFGRWAWTRGGQLNQTQPKNEKSEWKKESENQKPKFYIHHSPRILHKLQALKLITFLVILRSSFSFFMINII